MISAFEQLRRQASSRSLLGTRLLVRLDRRLDSGRNVTWRMITDRLETEAATQVTVDVFDTVLTRRILGDEALWWVTGSTLQADGCWRSSPSDFVVARRAAAHEHPTAGLSELYQDPALALGLRCPDGARHESELEAELAVAVPGAAAALRRLRKAGHRITFLSDMHLLPDALWRSLARCGLAADGDELVVSSDVGASKAAGTLFPALARRSTLPAWHVGNDLWSDVAMAERSGVRALPVRVAESSRLELLMVGRPGSSNSAVAAAARQVRARGAQLAGPEAAIVEAGADVAGQCLTAFLLWVREQCTLTGAAQVMFLARDGELPLQMARAMPTDHWEGLQLGYLEGSRRLWSVAAAAVIGVEGWIEAGTADERGFLRQQQHVIPWGSLLGRAGLHRGDLIGHPQLHGLTLEQPLPRHLTEAWRRLLADAGVRASLTERATEQLADLQQVLKAAGVGVGRMAVVDVGWRGQLAWQVSAVLRGLTGAEPVHLHFGGVDVAADAPPADVRRFAVDDRHSALPFPDVISCVETFTASGAARARSTRRHAKGRVELVFDPAQPQMQTEHRRLLRQSAVDVAACLPSRASLQRWGLQDRGSDEAVRKVLTSFWTRPTLAHARAGEQLAAEVDDAGHGVHPVATRYTVTDVRRAADRTWREGSLRLTAAPLRMLIVAALRVRDWTRATGQVEDDVTRSLRFPPRTEGTG